MSNSQSPPDEKFRLLHLKDIEVSFKDRQPKYPIKLKVLSGQNVLRAKEYENGAADNRLRWEANVHLSPDLNLEIVAKESHTIKWRAKRDFAAVSFDAEEMKKDNIITKEDDKSLISVKLTFEAPVAASDVLRKATKDSIGLLENKTVILDKLGSARKFVEVAKGFGDVVADLHPAAKAAMIAFGMLYEKLEGQEQVHKDASELIDDMSLFLPFTEVVDPATMANEMAKNAVKDFLDVFREACEFIVQYSTTSAIGDLISSQKSKVNKLTDTFKKAKMRYDWSIKTDIWRVNLKLEKIKDNEMLKLLHVSAFGPAGKEYYRTDKSCLEGTRISVLKQISEWAEIETDQKLFWLQGSPGSGKTAVANSVAHTLDQQRLLAGCFFCNKDDQDLKDNTKVIPSLAAHLAVWHQPFSEKLLSTLQGEEKNRLASKTLQEQFDLLIKGPVLALSADEQNQSPHPLVIVIDALDECGDNKGQRLRLAKILVQISQLVPWLKLFVTSTPLPEFTQAFEKSSTSLEKLNLDQAADTTRDIILYANYRAKLIAEDFDLSPDWLGDERISIFALQSRGLFIRTRNTFDYISGQVDVEEAADTVVLNPATTEPEQPKIEPPQPKPEPVSNTRRQVGSTSRNHRTTGPSLGIAVR